MKQMINIKFYKMKSLKRYNKKKKIKKMNEN